MVFGKKSLSKANGGFIDIHAHILPGFDDGSSSLEESVAMAKMAAATGTAAIIATPHSSTRRPLDHVRVKEAVETLNAAIDAEGINLVIHPGAEHRVFPLLFEEEPLITLADSEYVLIELPFDEFPFFMEDLVYKLRLRGLTPIIAHPERNTVVQKNIARLEPLLTQGCLIQLNGMSIQKRFGAERTAALRILKKGWAFAVASDTHNTTARPPSLTSAAKVLTRFVGADQADRLLRISPSWIVDEAVK